MSRHLPAALLLATATALAQETAIPTAPAFPDFVGATKVELGPIERFVERSYKFITPGKPVPNYPGFAYPMNDVLLKRSCESFDDAPTRSELALVSVIEKSVDATRYAGVRATTPANFHELCTTIETSPRTLADHLDSLMFAAEADRSLLESGHYRIIKGQMDHVAKFRTDCARPFLTATAPSFEVVADSIPKNALHHDIQWQPIDSDSAMDPDLGAGFMPAGGNPRIWTIEPQDRNRIAGRVFITSPPVNAAPDQHDTTGPIKLTAWYQSPFCETISRTWYLTSSSPLKELKPDFRSRVTDGFLVQADSN